MNTFDLTSQWYNWGSEDLVRGLPHENPRNHIEELDGLVSRCKQKQISEEFILCKIFPYTISGDAFIWFSKLQPRSLTCWEDIKGSFLGKFFSEAVATRSKRFDYMVDKMIEDHEKGIITSLSQISISQIMDFAYSEQNGGIGTATTHVKQPDIQVHHADESKQKDELNREKLVNHDTVEDDEYHVSGEQSKVEEADTKDPTSALIDSSNSESIDIRTSETIGTDICHRLIPSTIPDATTVYVRTERPKAIRDYNSPEDAYAKRSALRRSALQNTVLELHPAYISSVGQHSFHGFPHEDPTSHLETFVDLASTIKCNGVSEDYYLCKLFSYSLAGEAAYWFRKLPLGSLTTWNDIKYAFLNKFLYDAAENLEIEMRSMMEYMVEDDEPHVPGELSRIEEVDISDMSSEPIDTPTSTSIDIPTVTSIDTSFSTSIDPSLQTSIDTNSCCRSIPLEIPEKSSCPQDIADSTLKSIDVSSCYPDQKGEKEITMEDFLELEEFLELEDGQQLGDLDSSEEVTMEDFLELEEWLGELDKNIYLHHNSDCIYTGHSVI
ncbi:hypothetical protein YC2023_072259 [Brassica napus]